MGEHGAAGRDGGAAPVAAPAKATVSFDDFQRLDIRAGRVVRAEPHPAAHKPAYKLWIDFGPLGVRQSSAQITDLYRPEDLLGRTVIAVVNLPPKRVAGFVSEVLVLGVYSQRGVVLLAPDGPVAPGEHVG